MITPRFNLSQNENSLTITIRAPYCSLRELDISVEDDAFIFFCRPYYLRLNLPGNILENDRARSKFDSEEGEFTFTYDKENPGEHFPDLEYITKFLCSKVDVEEGGRKIELLATEGANPEGLEPCVPEVNNEKYGFAMRGGYNINNLDSEFCDVFKINPHKIKLGERAALRIKEENEKFDPEHYRADFMDDDEIKSVCAFDCPWRTIGEINFTSKELDFLKDLPNVEYNLSASQISYCHNSLLEILYAYCYDRRSTFFEGTCESGWTISTVSASLCWFEGFPDVKSAMVCAYRRSLIFPLHRSFPLCQQVFKDLKALLALGEKFLIRCLIEIYYVFLGADSGRFILNNLFVKDYIIYVMKWNKNLWAEVIKELDSMEIKKEELGLGLLEIEEESRCGNLINGLADLNLGDDSDDDDDDDDSSDDSSSDSGDSYSIISESEDDVLSELSTISREPN